MALEHDQATESVVFSGTPNPFGFAHAPVGTPRAVVALIYHGNSGTDMVTSVGYGGVTMTRIATGADTATEPGRCYAYFLGRDIPTGTQTLLIAHTAANIAKIATCITVVGSSHTRVQCQGILQENQANPQVTLTTPREALRYCGIYSGLAAPGNLSLLTNMSSVSDHDFGAFCGRIDRETTASSGSFTIGYTSASDDVGFVALAVMEEEISQRVQESVLVPMLTQVEAQRKLILSALRLADTATAQKFAAEVVITRLIQDALSMSDPGLPFRLLESERRELQISLLDLATRLTEGTRIDAVGITEAIAQLRETFGSDPLLISDASETSVSFGPQVVSRLIQDSLGVRDPDLPISLREYTRKELQLSLLTLAARLIESRRIEDARLLSMLARITREDKVDLTALPLRDAVQRLIEALQRDRLLISDAATAEAIVSGQVVERLIQDALAMADPYTRQEEALKPEAVFLPGIVAEVERQFPITVAPIQLVEVMRKLTELARGEAMILSDQATAQVELAGQILSRLAQDRVDLSDLLLAMSERTALLSEALVLADAVLSPVERLRTASLVLVLADAVAREVQRTILQADAMLLEKVALLLEREMTTVQAVLVADQVTAVKIAVAVIERLLQEALGVQDARSSARELLSSDAVATSISRLAETFRVVAEQTLLTDTATADKISVAETIKILQDALLMQDLRLSEQQHRIRDQVDVRQPAIAVVTRFLTAIQNLNLSDRRAMSELGRTLGEALILFMPDTPLSQIDQIIADAVRPLSDQATATRIVAAIFEVLAQDALGLRQEEFRDLLKTILDRTELTDAFVPSRHLDRLAQDTALISDQILRLLEKSIADTILPADSVSLDRLMTFADRIALADAEERSFVIGRLAQDIVQLSDVLHQLREAAFFETVLLTDAATAQRISIGVVERLIADAVLAADQAFKELELIRAIALVLSDASQATFIAGIQIIERLLADATALQDQRFSVLEALKSEPAVTSDARVGEREAIVPEPLVIAESAFLSRDRLVAEVLLVTDAAAAQRFLERLLTDDTLLSDDTRRLIEKALLDVTQVQDAATAQKIAFAVVERLLADAVLQKDEFSLARDKFFAETVIIADAAEATLVQISQVISRLAQVTLLMSDQVYREIEYTRQDRMDVQDEVLRLAAILRTATDLLALVDATERQLHRERLQVSFLLLDDTVARLMEMSVQEPVTLSDLATKLVSLAVLETLKGIRIDILAHLDHAVGTKKFYDRATEAAAFFDRSVGVVSE